MFVSVYLSKTYGRQDKIFTKHIFITSEVKCPIKSAWISFYSGINDVYCFRWVVSLVSLKPGVLCFIFSFLKMITASDASCICWSSMSKLFFNMAYVFLHHCLMINSKDDSQKTSLGWWSQSLCAMILQCFYYCTLCTFFRRIRKYSVVRKEVSYCRQTCRCHLTWTYLLRSNMWPLILLIRHPLLSC